MWIYLAKCAKYIEVLHQISFMYICSYYFIAENITTFTYFLSDVHLNGTIRTECINHYVRINSAHSNHIEIATQQ